MINLKCANQVREVLRKKLFQKECDFTWTFIRTYIDPRRHHQPEELSWQWQVKKDPSIYNCSLACVPKICPKPSFFPRFKKTLVPKDITSCKKKERKLSWKEYFSFLFPSKMIKQKPPLSTCRRLLALRREKCLEPEGLACCEQGCLPIPAEWYGQGVVHAVVSKVPQHHSITLAKPCPPAQHMIPRCIIVKKGLQKKKAQLPACLVHQVYKEPFSDFKGFTTCSHPDAGKFKCRVKCYHELPEVLDKSLRLACRSYGDFKDVDCPKPMFTRFKSIKILPSGDVRPIPATSSTPIEVKKGVCERKTLLRPRSLRNFSTSTNLRSEEDRYPGKMLVDHKAYLQPNKAPIETSNLMKRAGFEMPHPEIPKPKFRPWVTPSTIPKTKFQRITPKSMNPTKKTTTQPSKSFSTSVTDRFSKRREHGPRINSRSSFFSTSSVLMKNDKKRKGEQKEEKKEVVCSGCPGITAPPRKVEGKFKCRTRPGGKCKTTMVLGPEDPPINNPYWKCKGQALSKCNQPRPVVKRKERNYRMPCEEDKKKFHSSAVNGAKCCDSGCYPEPQKRIREQPKATEIKRDSCPSLKSKPPEEKPKGVFCKIAGIFGIGCGKKDCV